MVGVKLEPLTIAIRRTRSARGPALGARRRIILGANSKNRRPSLCRIRDAKGQSHAGTHPSIRHVRVVGISHAPHSDRVDPIAIRIAAFGEGLTLVGAIPGDISVYIITSAIGEGRHVLLVATGSRKIANIQCSRNGVISLKRQGRRLGGISHADDSKGGTHPVVKNSSHEL